MLVDSFQKTEIGEKEEKEEEKKRKKKRKKRRKREKRRGKVRFDLLKFPKVHRRIVKVSECHRLVSVWRGQEALMEILCQKNGALWLICMWGGTVARRTCPRLHNRRLNKRATSTFLAENFE